MPRIVPKDKQLTHNVPLRLTERDFNVYKELAEANGVSVQEIIRLILASCTESVEEGKVAGL